ncbi:hypothetical protein H2200_000129 [Cladophialophora chaetospira]|uniref:F-box domain-containing protein n=1 Tax=Cladophialophora chaetospira TaxID=386627 RepID=A0AA38XN64_9EURO|nr:hypothetical protein H2200_000129 [Cladophialophora chaetospira]
MRLDAVQKTKLPPISSSLQGLAPQLGFLQIPYELRLKIYLEFAFPDVVEHDGAGDLSVRDTQKALMVVCRRVYDEWSPIFFRTANCLVLHRISTDRVITSPSVNCLNAPEIAELLLKRYDDHRQRDVTTILYNTSMRNRLTRNEVPAPTQLVIREMMDLGRCLSSHRHRAHSLLHIDLWETPDKMYLDDPYCLRRINGWPLFSTSAAQTEDEHKLVTQVWKHASKDTRWKDVEIVYGNIDGKGSVRGDWHIEKEVRLDVHNDPKSGRLYYTVIKRVGLRFIHTGSRSTYLAKARAAKRTTLSYSNLDGGLVGFFETPKHDYWGALGR